MTFDPNPHLLRMIIIRCGNLLYPEDNNITNLYLKMASQLGVSPGSATTLSYDNYEIPNLIKLITIRAGEKIRELSGLPAENDLNKLFKNTMELLGIVDDTDSLIKRQVGVNKLPAPHEISNEDGSFKVPRRDCSKCGTTGSVILAPLCQSCEDAEGGKYKSIWKCLNKGCDSKDRSEKFFSQWLNELGIDIPNGPKQMLGIKTETNEGLQ